MTNENKEEILLMKKGFVSLIYDTECSSSNVTENTYTVQILKDKGPNGLWDELVTNNSLTQLKLEGEDSSHSIYHMLFINICITQVRT